MRFVVTPLAEQDLEAIGNYIAKDNPRRALSFVGELRSQCAKITKSPQAYRSRAELGEGVRSCSHGNYVIFFVVEESVVPCAFPPSTLTVTGVSGGSGVASSSVRPAEVSSGASAASSSAVKPVSATSYAFLNNLGLADFAVADEGSYVQCAVDLANDQNRLLELCQSLRERMRHSPLTDELRFVAEVEDAY
jgi:toxin ParE1/3/4